MGKKRKGAWKDVTPKDTSSLFVGGEGGFISLEEIDETLAFGLEQQEQPPLEVRVAKKKKQLKQAQQKTDKKSETVCVPEMVDLEEFTEWEQLRLHPLLVQAIASMGFRSPTPIQKACIPIAAHKGKDVIGAAETGSGKTLAFGLPILQRLLEEREKVPENEETAAVSSHLRALIVTPTRELALQICDHLRLAAAYTAFKIVPIVGGIASQKQERLLKKRPEIVVATPGRLWELMTAGEAHLLQLEYLSFFILDEADRMVEKGHFQELQSIIDMLPSTRKQGVEDNEGTRAKKKRQAMVFSATLTLPADFKKKLKRSLSSKRAPNEHPVAFLSQRAGISDNSEIVDLTPKDVLAQNLSEAVIECSEAERDACLYYLLKVHGCGRTIVFCTSIAALRRLCAILRLLQIAAWPLHAQLQQRQRLKTMDRFRAATSGVLVATDVAARGLDIPGVRTVIHYQLPHSAEMYVHRSGRTARADKDGCSIALICPTENSKYLSLCRALSKTSGLASFPVDHAYLPAIQNRISLALKIDKISRGHSQTKAKKTWFEQNAKALDINIEEDADDEVGGGLKSGLTLELKSLQEELHHLLSQPLESKAFSRRYIAGAALTPLAARQLMSLTQAKEGKPTVAVIGQEGVEPLEALKAKMSGIPEARMNLATKKHKQVKEREKKRKRKRN